MRAELRNVCVRYVLAPERTDERGTGGSSLSAPLHAQRSHGGLERPEGISQFR